MNTRWLGVLCVGSLLGVWAGCGSSGSGGVAGNDDGSVGNGGSSATGNGGSGNIGIGGLSGGTGVGSTGNGGSGTGAGPGDGGLPDVEFTYDGPGEQKEACAAVTVQAQLVPLDLYVVLDRSGSMVNPALGNLRWPPVRDALNSFFQSPTTAGIGIALTMFAHPTGASCNPVSYQTPLLAMNTLPGNATGHALALQTTMNNNAPVLGIGTPTESAMKGAVTFATGHKNANPGHSVAIILATDGIPGDASCSGEDSAGTQAAITAGFNGNPSIRTFVIGIDPNTTEMQTNLNAWANAGGGQFFDVGTAGGPAQFLAAMKAIQGSLLGCTFVMPKTDAGLVDPTKVKVLYTPGSGAQQELPHVNDAASCTGPGWYYDNNANPATIELCPNSCTTVQADSAGKIDIELGCLGS
jgi:hypothetical protein